MYQLNVPQWKICNSGSTKLLGKVSSLTWTDPFPLLLSHNAPQCGSCLQRLVSLNSSFGWRRPWKCAAVCCSFPFLPLLNAICSHATCRAIIVPTCVVLLKCHLWSLALRCTISFCTWVMGKGPWCASIRHGSGFSFGCCISRMPLIPTKHAGCWLLTLCLQFRNTYNSETFVTIQVKLCIQAMHTDIVPLVRLHSCSWTTCNNKKSAVRRVASVLYTWTHP